MKRINKIQAHLRKGDTVLVEYYVDYEGWCSTARRHQTAQEVLDEENRYRKQKYLTRIIVEL